uniref:Uncharacterized protein n=1 Tax=Arundo donax TaxID=35708 RepID=A0A0A9AKM7_ARUDO
MCMLDCCVFYSSLPSCLSFCGWWQYGFGILSSFM